MKIKLMLLTVVLFPLIASANADRSIVGTYKSCVPWTRINGVEHSKGLEFVLTETRSMQFQIKFYTGNSNCDGTSENLVNAQNFSVIESIGKYPNYLILVLKDQDGSGYYRINFGSDTIVVESSKSMPIKYDFNRTVVLKRTE